MKKESIMKLATACLIIIFLCLGATQILQGGGTQVITYGLIFGSGIGLMFYMRWFQKFVSKVNALTPLLTENPEQYVKETELLLQGKRPNNVRAMLTMNIASAYVQMGDYVSAKKKLLAIKSRSLKKTSAAVYFINLTYVLIHLGENETALQLMERYQKEFQRLPMGGNLPHMKAFLQIFAAIETGAWEEAEKQLTQALEVWKEPVVGIDFTFLQKKINNHNKREEKRAKHNPRLEKDATAEVVATAECPDPMEENNTPSEKASEADTQEA